MMRTQGRVWASTNSRKLVKSGTERYLAQQVAMFAKPEDAAFYKTVHNVANKLDAMGYDGLKAIENLLLLIAQAKRGPTTPCTEGSHTDDKWLAENMRHFMQSIQRKDDEPTT